MKTNLILVLEILLPYIIWISVNSKIITIIIIIMIMIKKIPIVIDALVTVTKALEQELEDM